MAIKHGSKVDKSFSASSMTDLMFLLLLFLLIATTLINPNALKLMHAIRQQFDPKGILNWGKSLPEAANTSI